MDDMLEEWSFKKRAYENGDISEEEYVDWKLNWTKDELRHINLSNIPTLKFD